MKIREIYKIIKRVLSNQIGLHLINCSLYIYNSLNIGLCDNSPPPPPNHRLYIHRPDIYEKYPVFPCLNIFDFTVQFPYFTNMIISEFYFGG